MNTTVRSYLIEIARLPSRKTIYDMELSKVCGLELELKDPQFAKAEMGRILSEISYYEFSQGRPLLGSLVVTKDGDYLDEVLYTTAVRCAIPGWESGKENINFAVAIRNACYDFWYDDKNYLKSK